MPAKEPRNTLTYANWKKEFSRAAGGSPRLEAQLWNLKYETRLGLKLALFRRLLGRVFKDYLANGLGAADAAIGALKNLCDELCDPGSKWLGLLPGPGGGRIPQEMFTHLPVRDLIRYVGSGPIDETNPPRRVVFSRPFKITATGVRSRFIWLTFEPDGSPPSDDPTEVVRELGLAHLVDDGFLFRFWLRTDGKPLYIPSCLDARLYEAWAPPPSRHTEPWGLTRDLVTGQSCKPELLTDAVAHRATLPTATMVSPPGRRVSMGNLPANFLVNR